MATLIHFVGRQCATVAPLCGDGRTAVNWTTRREVVTCPECARRLAAGIPPRQRIRDLPRSHGGPRP